MAYPNGWRQLTNVPEDRADLSAALTLLQNTYPPGQYANLTENRLRRKMVLRWVEFTQGGPAKLVLSLRVFCFGSDMAAFFFARHRRSDPTHRGYCLTLGVSSNMLEADILREASAICGYMKNQDGGHRMAVLSKVVGVPVSPSPFPPTTRQQLDNAFAKAANPPNPNQPKLLVDKGVVEPEPREPWPKCYMWLINV